MISARLRRALPALSLALALMLPGASCFDAEGGGTDGGERASSSAPSPMARAAAGLRIALLPWPPKGAEIDAGAYLDLIEAVELRGSDRRFGGFSGVEVSPDGARLLAVTDRGMLLEAGLERDASGRLSAVRPLRWGAIPGPGGRRAPPLEQDAESLALPPGAAPGGPMAIGFEQLHRIAALDGPEAPRRPLIDFHGLLPAAWNNAGFEALAMRPDGALLLVEEGYPRLAPQTGWLWPPGLSAPPPGDPRKAMRRLSFQRRLDLRIVGADIDAEGRLWTAERGFDWVGGFSFGFSVYAPRGDGWGPPLRLLRIAGEASENVESVAVWRDPAGRIRLLALSDDNFALVQRTVLFDFAVKPETLEALAAITRAAAPRKDLKR